MDTQDNDIKKSAAEVTKSILVAWGVTATLVALVSASLAVALFLRTHQAFLGVPDRALAGKYKWSEAGQETFLTLYPDHNFTKEGGPKLPFHRWEVARDGALLIVWQTGISRFTRIVAPGRYEGRNWNNSALRMEKQE
jgi:hypothetical protein